MYNRLFTKILDSSIWLEPSSVRIVWITLLAAMDEDGYAHFSALENLASRARVTLEETVTAVTVLSSPDPNSANPANEGRRVERVPGGFIIINSKDHRKTLNREIQREQTRLRVARHREREKAKEESVTSPLRSVTPASDIASASEKKGECEGKEDKRRPTTEKETIEYCLTLGLNKDDGRYFWSHWQANGFTNNKSPIKDWRATIRSWKLARHCPSQKTGEAPTSHI